jgi:hypothetical protein
LSPGDKVFAIAASQQPEPDEGKIKGTPVSVLKTLFSPGKSDSYSLGKMGERWSSIDIIIALWILSGKLVGPGTNKKLRPAKSILLKKLIN